MTTALVVGVGAVGTRAARQLVDTPAIDRVLLADRDGAHVGGGRDALGPDAQAVDFAPGDPIPADVDVVATALPSGVDHDVVAAAIAAGVPSRRATTSTTRSSSCARSRRTRAPPA